MRICICGGGSLGHVCAGFLASQHDVEMNIYSGHPDRWQDTVTVTDPDGKVFAARLHKVSGNAEDVISGQDIILLCLPGYLIEKTLRDIKPFIGNAIVGTVVSSTGFFFFAHDVLDARTPLFGFQRVPFIARIVEYGKSANLLGYKSSLKVATENISDKESFRKQIESLFKTPTTLLDNYLEVSLSNSNPILHTSRLYTMFRGKEDALFDHMILFYKEWTVEAAEKMIAMDKEFSCLLNALKITSIPSLLDYYESTDAVSLTDKLHSIAAFQTIGSPMKEVEGGWKADFNSRYFTEDFPFGLRWIRDLAHEYAIPTPVIDEVYSWGISRTSDK